MVNGQWSMVNGQWSIGNREWVKDIVVYQTLIHHSPLTIHNVRLCTETVRFRTPG